MNSLGLSHQHRPEHATTEELEKRLQQLESGIATEHSHLSDAIERNHYQDKREAHRTLADLTVKRDAVSAELHRRRERQEKERAA